VLVVEIDAVRLQSLERRVGDLLDPLRPTVESFFRFIAVCPCRERMMRTLGTSASND